MRNARRMRDGAAPGTKRVKPSWRTVVVVALLCVLMQPVLFVVLFVWMEIGSANADVPLLCRTDHQALLAACQELSEQLTSGQLSPSTYRRSSGGSWEPPIEMPEIIRDLRPVSVSIDRDGHVAVVVIGGLGGFGVHAYPESYEAPSKNPWYGHRELIPNLWYFHEEYDMNPNYDETVERIIQRHRRPQKQPVREQSPMVDTPSATP